MKSRAFRKFYYFARKFFQLKLEEDIEKGSVQVDEFGSYKYLNGKYILLWGLDNKSKKTDDQEERNQMKHDRNKHLNTVFQAPRFDIIDFKEYFKQEEYDSLVKDFIDYTRGTTKEEKAAFIQHTLLGNDTQQLAKSKVSNNLRALFKKLGLETNRNVDASKLFDKLVTESFASMSSTHNKEM